MISTSTEIRKTISASFKEKVTSIADSLQPLAKIQDETGMTDAQVIKYGNNMIMASYVGVELVNKTNMGWTGYFTSLDMPYENIYVGMNLNGGKDVLGTKLLITSNDKLEDYKKGVIITFTVFLCCGRPAYSIVGNTKNIGAIIEQKMDKSKNPKTPYISIADMMNGGFKIVALDMTKEEVLDRLMLSQKKFASKMTIDDIYTKDDLKELVEEMAK